MIRPFSGYLQNKGCFIIQSASDKIERIRSQLKLYAISITDLVHDDMLAYRDTKEKLEFQRFLLESKLRRIEKNLAGGKYFRPRNMQKLIELFPQANVEKLDKVEAFHSSIAQILKQQLQEAEKTTRDSLHHTKSEIDKVNAAIKSCAPKLQNPGAVVEQVCKLNQTIIKAKEENARYDESIAITADYSRMQADYAEALLGALNIASGTLNATMRKLTDQIYSAERRSPQLEITQNNYSFRTYEDSGTGKAYSDLIIFDIAMLLNSDLPFLIHDSLLFKNIENRAVPEIVNAYSGSGKQSFIAIDEFCKYTSECQEILNQRAVLRLSNDHLLYGKDWRRDTSRSQNPDAK